VKRTIIWFLLAVFLVTISFVGVSCKTAAVSTETAGETAASAATTAAGAETTAASGKEVVTLKSLFMSQAGYSEDDIRNITNSFMEANPNIKVDLTFVAYENLHDKIVTSASAGSGGYDTILIDTVWPAEFASAGFLLDITDKVSKEMTDDIWPAALKAVTWEDKLVGMPWLNDVEYFYYNEKMIKQAGFDAPPKTWTELIEQSKVLKEKGIAEYPFY